MHPESVILFQNTVLTNRLCTPHKMWLYVLLESINNCRIYVRTLMIDSVNCDSYSDFSASKSN